MLNLVELTGKRIIITGASRGIGRETAIVLSRLGAKLCLVARDEEKLKDTLNALEGNGHIYKLCDVSDLEGIEACVKNIVSEFGVLDGLVYCAGIGNSMPLNVMKVDKFSKVLQVNLSAFVEFVRCCTKKNHYGEGMRIVGISSIASFQGDKTHTSYSASKAGMDGAVRCMAVELADKHICINTVAPAMINTDMYKGYLNQNGEESDGHRRILEKQYLGIGEPSDVANAIAFLMSSAARFITGICLPVDGGALSH